MAWMNFYFYRANIVDFIENHCRMMIYREFPELSREKKIETMIKNEENEEIRKIAEVYRKAVKELDGFEQFYIYTHELAPESREIIKDLSDVMFDVEKNVIQILFSSQREKGKNTKGGERKVITQISSPDILDKYLYYLKPLRRGRKVKIKNVCIGREITKTEESDFSEFYDTVFSRAEEIASYIENEDKKEKFLKFVELGKKLLFYTIVYEKGTRWGKILEEFLERIDKYNKKILKEIEDVFLAERVVETMKRPIFWR